MSVAEDKSLPVNYTYEFDKPKPGFKKTVSECAHPNLRVKHHSTWVGKFCPDCGAGGSVSKRFTKRGY